MNFWQWLKNLFGKKQTSTSLLSRPAESAPIKLKIALIVGHTRGNYGTETYRDEHEYDWNNDVVNMIIKKLANPNVFRVERSASTYTKAMKQLATDAKAKGAQVAIEFHLNAAGIPSARGCEMLVSERKKNLTKARQIITAFSSQFGIRLRHDKGIKKLADGDRGGGFVREMEALGIDAYLMEPFFCDYKTEDSAQFVEPGGKEKYADFWIDVIKHW
jgi:N-acetylmuramoyl-L-alanine amidase